MLIPYRYITALHAYISSFSRKTQPLVDVGAQQKEAGAEFENLWREKKLPGWTDSEDKKQGVDGKAEGEGVWCSACKCL